MQHVVFLAPGKLQWREAPDPVLHGPAEAIVRPIVVGRCDLDSLYLAGRMPLAAGEPIGHEIIAEIVDIGSQAGRRFRIGQRVIVSAQICCGGCGMCRRGYTGRCEAVPFAASYGMGRAGDFGGGLADLVGVPYAEAMLVPIPSNSDPTAMIGLADMATDAWRAVGPPLAARPGASVLVLGGATPVIGIYAAGIAVALGAGTVDYVDANEHRRNSAIAYGARAFDDVDQTDASGYDIVVDASGSAQSLLASLRRIGPAAVVTSVAPDPNSPAWPMLDLYMKGVTYRVGRPDCRTGHDGALHAWSTCGFDPNRVRPTIHPFEQACEAWCDPSLYVAVARVGN